MNVRFPLSIMPALSLLLSFSMIAAGRDARAQDPPGGSGVVEDYSSLSKPEIAATVKLTDEQKTSIQQLISERDTAIAAAEESARPPIIAAANEKLKAVLTADQQRLFVSLFVGKTLRFNFRTMKWVDVLNWISKEADISLVMETPPPGTFSYSDSKDYSTIEAIDLLNGWLLTKGFTLVRRERMLMCLDLKGGLPEGTIPRIPLAELATRGRYEFVSVLIPLDGRPPESVLLEVKPLLGSYGKAEPLPQTQQILVSDTAANLRVIEQIVQKIPVPQKPTPPPPVEPPKPLLTVYPIQHANPGKVGDVLRQMITGTIFVDETALQISVNAIPTEHDKVKTIIEQLESNQGPEMQPKLQIYPVKVSDASQMITTLKLIAPDGQYRIDAVSGKLIVFAADKDQARVAESLKMIQAEQHEMDNKQLQVYALNNAEPGAVSTILATVVPTARVTVNTATRSLIAFGTLADHESIRALIQQLESQTDTNSKEKVLRTYPASATALSTITSLMATAVPRAQVLSDAANQRLLVMATADEHTHVEMLLKSMAIAETEGKRLQIHEADRIDTTSVSSLLAKLIPQATVTVDAANRRLLVVASEPDHAKLTEVLEQVRTSETSDRTMELYSIKDLGPTASTVLSQSVPTATITAGARPDQLAIVATSDDHRKLRQILQQLEANTSSTPQKSLVVHQIKGITPQSVLQVLQPLVDADVRLTIDPTGQQLFVHAFPEKQEHLTAVVRQVTEKLASTGIRSTRSYVVGQPNADVAQEALSALFPDAKIVTDSDRKILIATATEDQHVTIAEIAAQMKGELLDGDLPVPAVYSLHNSSATEVQTLLRSMYQQFGNVRVSVNEKTGRLVVLARKEQHDAIRPLIEQLDSSSDNATNMELAVFRLNRLDGLAVQQALQPLLPRAAQVTTDRVGGQLLVSAPKSEMPALREIILQMMNSQGETEGLETHSYRLRRNEADEAQEVLEKLFPDATLVTDDSQEILVATATPAQHETIASVVQQMSNAAPNANTPQAIAYPLKTADGKNAVEVFRALFPRTDDVRLSFDEKTRSLIAVARPDQHQAIKKLIEQLEPGYGEIAGRTLEIYALPAVDGVTAMEVAKGVLQSIDPSATVSWEKNSKQLIVSTTAAGHQTVDSAVKQFQESDPREMDVIQLRILSATSAQNAIEGLYGDSFVKSGDYPVIQADEDSQQLLLRGSKKQLQDIRTLLIKMGETGLSMTGESSNSNLRVVPVQGDIETTLKKIQDLWPRVRRNPIRILRPGDGTQPVAPESESNGQFSVPAEKLNSRDNASVANGAQEHTEEPTPIERNAEPPAAQPADESQAAETDQEPAPILVIPGPGRITIASDDTDALDQFESILRASSTSPGGSQANRNRDFSVYQLRNAGSEEVSQTLKSIYESRAGTLAFGSVVIVAEPRMNALIVYGGRTDRDRIEQLLEILDTEKLPDSGRIFRTQVIPLTHADARKVEIVLKGVYRTEMTAGGSRRAIDIPTGIDSTVANMLRQINAAASAPLLTIEVQVETNSLVVKAPQNLIEELSELVSQLDDTSESSRARGVTLIPLKQTNTRRVMRILNDVLD